jgi:hypothetical protein
MEDTAFRGSCYAAAIGELQGVWLVPGGKARHFACSACPYTTLTPLARNYLLETSVSAAST